MHRPSERERPLGCPRDHVGVATGVPQIADVLLHRPSQQSRAMSGRPLPFCVKWIADCQINGMLSF